MYFLAIHVGGEFLSKWASIVTILSLVGVPLAYFTRQHEKEMEVIQRETKERKQVSRNLYGELHDALDAIKGEKYPQDLLDVKFCDEKATYANRFLNHAIYDSLVYSGKISFLRYELQQKIQDNFNTIQYHNYYLKLAEEISNKDTNGQITENAFRYYKLLDKYERRLLEDIPGMMKKLKEEFKFEPPKT